MRCRFAQKRSAFIRVQIHPKAVAVFPKAQRFIESMRRSAPGVAREHDLVASGFPAHVQCEAHHPLPNSASLPFRKDRDIFYDAGGRTPFCQIIHDQEREGAHDLPVSHGHVNMVIRIGLHPSEDLPGPGFREGLAPSERCRHRCQERQASPSDGPYECVSRFFGSAWLSILTQFERRH